MGTKIGTLSKIQVKNKIKQLGMRGKKIKELGTYFVKHEIRINTGRYRFVK